MTDNRTTELLPCPFCGGEAHVYKNNLWHVACERAHNGCVTMSAFVTEAEAIAAWNTRAERTCKCIAEYAESPIDGKTIVLYRCSACHELMRPYMRFCPSCGAKVVGV